MRVMVELLHILIGLAAASALTFAASWAYPPAREVIWWCGAAAITATILFGIGPLCRAARADRGRV